MKILFVGDDITAASSDGKNGFVPLAAIAYGYPDWNFSVVARSAEIVSFTTAKSIQAMRDFGPDIVFLMVGTFEFLANPEKLSTISYVESQVQNIIAASGLGKPVRWVVASIPFVNDIGGRINYQINEYNQNLKNDIAAGKWRASEPGGVVGANYSYEFADVSGEINKLIWRPVPGQVSPPGPDTAPIYGQLQPAINDILEPSLARGVLLTRRGYQMLAGSVVRQIQSMTGKPPLKAPPLPPPPSPAPSDKSSCGELVGPLSFGTGPKFETLIFDTKNGTAKLKAKSDLQMCLLAPAEKAVFQTNLAPWKKIVEKYASQFKVPGAWVSGLIWAGSKGDPSTNLMGVPEELWLGHTAEDMKDPDLNVQLGTKFLGQILAMRAASKVPDVASLPRIASVYNAGGDVKSEPHPSDDDPLWRLKNDPGYITRAVLASNTSLALTGAVGGTSAKNAGVSLVAVGIMGAGAIALLVPWNKILRSK